MRIGGGERDASTRRPRTPHAAKQAHGGNEANDETSHKNGRPDG